MADIVDLAVENGSFNTLVAAVKAAGLVDILKGPGPFTVFAPTDSAFEKLPAGTVEKLLQDIPRLKQILLYHVVSGHHMAEDIMEQEQLETVQGESIMIDISEGVKLNDASVVQTDIEADNGVIHIIDTVIMPKVAAQV